MRSAAVRVPSVDVAAELEELVEQLRAENRTLRDALAGTRRRDRDLLAAVVQHVPNIVFTTRELLAHATVHADLHAAFKATGVRSPRALGKRLRAIVACPVPGFHVEQVARTRDGHLWAVSVLV